MSEKVIIYTDGACSGNPGPGGWGAILMYKGAKKEISGGMKETTNNIMEMTAVIEALKFLTHDDSVEYMEYIRNIKQNPIAKRVKLADLWHNFDDTRMRKPTIKDIRRREKYWKAIRFLIG